MVQHSVSFGTVKWNNFYVKNLILPMLLSPDHKKEGKKKGTPVHQYLGSVGNERLPAFKTSQVKREK
jgi:hypothetical protein